MRMNEHENGFQGCIIQLAEMYGWLCYHAYDSRKCTSNGFPDLALLHPVWHKFLMRELKVPGGKLSMEQAIWRDGLKISGIDADVWEPKHWPEIVRILTGEDSR